MIIHIFLDFDGTLTGLAGNNLVQIPFYKSLFKAITPFNYKTTPMHSKSEVIRRFTEQYGVFDNTKEYSSELITHFAIKFLKHFLKKSQVKLHIVTLNRADYVKYLLTYQGFSDLEITQIAIDDSGSKKNYVRTALNQCQIPSPIIYLFEDNSELLSEMKSGAEQAKPKIKIKSYCKAPKNFDWISYLAEIEEILKLQASM